MKVFVLIALLTTSFFQFSAQADDVCPVYIDRAAYYRDAYVIRITHSKAVEDGSSTPSWTDLHIFEKHLPFQEGLRTSRRILGSGSNSDKTHIRYSRGVLTYINEVNDSYFRETIKVEISPDLREVGRISYKKRWASVLLPLQLFEPMPKFSCVGQLR